MVSKTFLSSSLQNKPTNGLSMETDYEYQLDSEALF